MNINILHFSDLHFKSNDVKIIDMIDKVKNNIENIDKIDIVIFSGDLLYSPSKDEFTNVHNNFIKILINSLNVNINQCYFAIGNHDVDLQKRNKPSFIGLKELIINKNDKKEISKIIAGDTQLEEFSDYVSFLKTLSQNTLIENNALYSVYIDNINNISVGTVSLNTSLFMEGSKEDFGNLYIIEDTLLQAYQKIKECSIKIINLHHPLDWFRNKQKIEKIIIDKFSIAFFGHEHMHDGKHIIDAHNRDIIYLHASSLYSSSKEHSNGFCLYTYNIDEKRLVVSKKEFNNHSNIFENIEDKNFKHIDLLKKASKPIRNLHICSNIYPKYKKHINKYLAINLTSDKNIKDINDIYIDLTISKEKKSTNEKEEFFFIKDILSLDNNLILQGKKESGKTTLLNKISLTCLKSHNELITVYIPGDELYNENSLQVFIAKISDYLGEFYSESEKLNINDMVKEKRFLLLIDDVQNIKTQLMKEIIGLENKIISTFSKKEYDVDVDEDSVSYSNQDHSVFDNFVKLNIKPLTARDNRALTKSIVPSSVYGKIYNKVIKTIINLRLPSNPFITTLVAWMYVEKVNIRENEPQIIDVFLDFLLEKSDLSATFKGKLNFIDKKDILATIAIVFFKKNHLAVKENEILSSIIKHSEKYYAFSIDAKDILSYFYKRKILIKNNNNLVRFSYRVFYFYFISLSMINNKDFYNTIINNRTYVVNMRDELKYYATLKRDDLVIIKKIEEYLTSNNMTIKFTKLPNTKSLKSIENIGTVETVETVENESYDEINMSEEENRTKDKIDNLKTEARESHIEEFNKEEILDISIIKQSKEEFFVLNMIYAEFIKYLTNVDIKEKEKYFKKTIRNYTRIYLYWENTLSKDALLNRFIKKRLPKNINIGNENFKSLKEMLKSTVLHMIVDILKTTLNTPKMAKLYLNAINDKTDIHRNLFAIILETELEENYTETLNHIENFVSNTDDLMLLDILTNNLIKDLALKSLSSAHKVKLKKLLVDTGYKMAFLFSGQKHNRKKISKDIDEIIKLTKILD